MYPPSSPLVRPSKPVILGSRSFSRKAYDHGLHDIEADLEIIDLDAAPPAMRSPSFSRRSPSRLSASAGSLPWVTQGFGEHMSTPTAVKQAEADLKALVQEGAAMESRLRNEAQPSLTAAGEAREQKRSRVEDVRKALDMDGAEEDGNTAVLTGFTKGQISEVRQLARNPPEHLRRALIAVWLVLNCDRYRGKAVVQLSEERGWKLCQKMLADNSFVSRIQVFDPSSLEDVPHLLLHVARVYFGFQDSDVCIGDRLDSPRIELHKSLSEGALSGALCSPPLRRVSLLTSASASFLPKPLNDSKARPNTSGSLSTLGKIGLSSSMSSRALPRLPLDLQEVQHASEPCGAILRWLRTLVLDRARHAFLRQELTTAGATFAVAERSLSSAERLVAEIASELAANQLKQARHEQAIANLRQEALQQCARAAVRIPDLPAARSRCRRVRPPCDITVTKTNFAKAKWWRSCERFKIPPSPSRILKKELEAW